MRLLLLPALLLLLTTTSHGQSSESESTDGAADTKKTALLSDLQMLEAESRDLDQPLARARAKAEVADAAWPVDQEWAKSLLREAYELALPAEEERARLRELPVGSPPRLPSSEDRTRRAVRRRVLQVASRDKAFGNEMSKLAAQDLGKVEEHIGYGDLAHQAVKAGDKEAAADYVLKALEADPTQTYAPSVISDIAVTDRATADNLTLRYIERVRASSLARENQSEFRVSYMLRGLAFPESNIQNLVHQRNVPPPGPEVIRAYISYVLDSVSRLEPSELQKSRLYLLSVWGALKKYAPEMTVRFHDLEVRSRRPGERAHLPQNSLQDDYRKLNEARVKEALDSDVPDETAINILIDGGKFDKARDLLGKFTEGGRKTELAEKLNRREAVSLAAGGDTVEATKIAGQLNKAVSLLNVYPVIISKCVAKKDQQCVRVAIYQAMRQLEGVDAEPATPPAGIPAAAVLTKGEFDPVTQSLSKLAKLAVPVDHALALDVLDEAVKAANRSGVDAGRGVVGIEADVFQTLAPRDEARVYLAARSLTDRLARIAALASLGARKARELAPSAKAQGRSKEVNGK